MRKTIFTLALLITVCTLSAQETQTEKRRSDDTEFSGIRIKSLGVGFGYFSPELDYWNERTPWTLSGNLMPSLHADVQLLPFLNSRMSVSFFSTEKEKTRVDNWGPETIGLQLIPVSLSLYVPVNLAGFTANLGGGADLMPVGSSYLSPEGKQTGKGSTTTGHLLLGVEKKLSGFAIGLEGKYILGNYNQLMQADSNATPTVEKVSLNGLYLGLTFKYLL